jgi:hypothetical protein
MKYTFDWDNLENYCTPHNQTILKRYAPYIFIESEYYNNGFGDEGEYIYLEFDVKMLKEDWDTDWLDYHLDRDNYMLKIDKCFLLEYNFTEKFGSYYDEMAL